MTEIYSGADLQAAKKQKKKVHITFFSVTGVFIAVAAALFVYFLFEPYGSPKETPLLVTVCTLTGLYAVFAYLFLSIKFSRVRRYCIFLSRVLSRKSVYSEGTFMRTNEETVSKDGVDLKSMILVEWSEKEKDYMERKILLDAEKAVPKLRPGDLLGVNTYSNVLVSYEVLNRAGLEGTPFEGEFEKD